MDSLAQTSDELHRTPSVRSRGIAARIHPVLLAGGDTIPRAVGTEESLYDTTSSVPEAVLELLLTVCSRQDDTDGTGRHQMTQDET